MPRSLALPCFAVLVLLSCVGPVRPAGDDRVAVTLPSEQLEAQLGIRLLSTTPVDALPKTTLVAVVLTPRKLSRVGLPDLKRGRRVVVETTDRAGHYVVIVGRRTVRVRADETGRLLPCPPEGPVP